MERRTNQGKQFVGEREGPPTFSDPPQLLFLGAVVIGGSLKEGKGGGPLRVGRSVEARHRRTLMRTEEDSLLRADGVEDGPNVLHASLQVREEAALIGEASATLVEQD